MPKLTNLAIILTSLFITACNPGESPTNKAGDSNQIETVAELDKGPGNITVTPSGDIIVSLHQFYGDDIRVARLYDDGKLRPFAATANVNSVLGLQADSNGIVWLLDNAMRAGTTRRLVGWNSETNRVEADIDLSAVTTANSCRRCQQQHGLHCRSGWWRRCRHHHSQYRHWLHPARTTGPHKRYAGRHGPGNRRYSRAHT